MSVILLCTDAALRVRIVEHLAGIRVVLSDTWNHTDATEAHTDCVIAATDSFARDASAGWSLAASVRLPVVRVVAGHAAPVRRGDGFGGESVSVREIDRELRPAVLRVASERFFFSLGRCWARDDRLAPCLALALQIACQTDIRVTSVKELALTVHRSPRTIEHHWQRFAAEAGRPKTRIHTVIWWLLVLRAVCSRNCGTPWGDIPRCLGIHPHTLARVAARTVGLSLRQLRYAPGESVVNEFVDYCSEFGLQENSLRTLLGNCAFSGYLPHLPPRRLQRRSPPAAHVREV